MEIAIIAIGYNRIYPLLRLIQSLQNANYGEDIVDLIVSLDNCGSSTVKEAVEAVQWKQGKIIIRTFAERQGLRKHIISCGDYLEQYDALIVLEDDLIVSPAFYSYSKACVLKYSDCDEIAGISLYCHAFNQFAFYPFIPHSSAYDTFFMQLAQSWGQIWLKKSWKEFKLWYLSQEDKFEITTSLPKELEHWGKNSWLKYHLKYCVEAHKYFVYPYVSYTTCFSEEGEHTSESSNLLQVPMCIDSSKELKLADIHDPGSVFYDVFYERLDDSIANVLGIEHNELIIDLYGIRKVEGSRRYILTSQSLNYKIIKSFGRKLRPHEDNILFGINGDAFKLYDTSIPNDHNRDEGNEDIEKYVYYHKIFGRARVLMLIALREAKKKALNRFWRKKK